MLEYHAAYYKTDRGWYVAKVLDFPGVLTQGRTLDKARHMLADALREMTEWYLEDGLAIPTIMAPMSPAPMPRWPALPVPTALHAARDAPTMPARKPLCAAIALCYHAP